MSTRHAVAVGSLGGVGGCWRRRRLALACFAAVLLATVWLAGLARAALPSNCSQSGATVTCTFTYTGAAQTWIVPSGVGLASFKLYGAEGGYAGSPGGLGAEVSAALPVDAGTAVVAPALLWVSVARHGRGRRGRRRRCQLYRWCELGHDR